MLVRKKISDKTINLNLSQRIIDTISLSLSFFLLKPADSRPKAKLHDHLILCRSIHLPERLISSNC